MVLFGDLLNLPIPVFPQSLADLFPAGWSQKQILRVTAAVMARRGPRRLPRQSPPAAEHARIDVADHSGRI